MNNFDFEEITKEEFNKLQSSTLLYFCYGSDIEKKANSLFRSLVKIGAVRKPLIFKILYEEFDTCIILEEDDKVNIEKLERYSEQIGFISLFYYEEKRAVGLL